MLYWLVSNVLAIGQQYLTNRMIGAVRAGRGRGAGHRIGAPAKRAAEKK